MTNTNIAEDNNKIQCHFNIAVLVVNYGISSTIVLEIP